MYIRVAYYTDIFITKQFQALGRDIIIEPKPNHLRGFQIEPKPNFTISKK